MTAAGPGEAELYSHDDGGYYYDYTGYYYDYGGYSYDYEYGGGYYYDYGGYLDYGDDDDEPGPAQPPAPARRVYRYDDGGAPARRPHCTMTAAPPRRGRALPRR